MSPLLARTTTGASARPTPSTCGCLQEMPRARLSCALTSWRASPTSRLARSFYVFVAGPVCAASLRAVARSQR